MGDDEGKKLFVGRLPADINEDEIKYVFDTYGKVVDVFIHEKEGLGGARSAFVVYDSKYAAESAVKVLHEVYRFREDSKEAITCTYPRPKGGGGGGGGGGYDRPGGGDRVEPRRGFDRGPPERAGFDRGGPDRGGPPRGYDRANDRDYDRGYDRGGGYERDLRGGYDRGSDRGGGYDNRGGDRRDGYDRYGRGPPLPDRGGYDGYGRGGHDRGPPSRGGYEQPRPRSRSRDRYFSDFGEPSRMPPPRKGPPSSGGGSKLYVANLPSDVTKDALDYVFSSYGRVQDIHVMTGRSKSGRAAAFVIYGTAEQATKCIMAMQQGYEIRPGEGNILVKYADDQQEKGGGGGRYRS